jgi:hypothetical protein
MRILIGTVEKSNMIELYKKAFKSLGHEVITIAEPHVFFNENQYTHDLTKPSFLFRPIKNKIFRRLNTVKWFVAKRWIYFHKVLLYYKYRNRIDLMLVFGDGFYTDAVTDFNFLHKKNKKIVQVFFGGDARCWEAFNQEYKIDISTIEKQPINNENFNAILTRLRKAELYANSIYSLPDQAGLALRPFFRLYMPFEYQKYKFTVNGRPVPKVIHIESKLPYKGESLIYAAIDKLKKQGVAFDFQVYKNLSHKEVINKLEDADILVDEVMIFGPGTLTYEAIACGCAVATKVQEGHIVKDHLCNLEIEDIEKPIKEFILNKDKRISDLKKAYEVLKLVNDPQNIAKDIIQRSETDIYDFSKYDYQANFFAKGYHLPAGHIVSEQNKKLTRMVFDKYYKDEELKQSLIDRKLM